MASEAEVSEQLSSIFERLLRYRDLSLFLPFLLGFTSSSTTQNSDQENQETQATDSQNDRIILINPFTQGMVVIEGTANLGTLLRELAAKSGQPPASKASIEALPRVDLENLSDQDDSECAICLEDWRNSEEASVVKEMPCKHRFHGDCIEKWLKIHGSCPVCRHKMPADDDGFMKKRDEEGGEERRRIGREVWVSFSFSRIENSNQNSSSDSTLSGPNLDQEMDD